MPWRGFSLEIKFFFFGFLLCVRSSVTTARPATPLVPPLVGVASLVAAGGPALLFFFSRGQICARIARRSKGLPRWHLAPVTRKSVKSP